MPYLKKISAFTVASAVVMLVGCTTVAEPVKSQQHNHGSQTAAAPQDGHKMKMHEEMSSDEMIAMHKKMHEDHVKMSKMDMSKMDMSKMSTECQDMMKKMKAKMSNGAQDAPMKGKGMENMGERDMAKMTAMKAKHDKCMTEMKEASSSKHSGHH